MGYSRWPSVCRHPFFSPEISLWRIQFFGRVLWCTEEKVRTFWSLVSILTASSCAIKPLIWTPKESCPSRILPPAAQDFLSRCLDFGGWSDRNRCKFLWKIRRNSGSRFSFGRWSRKENLSQSHQGCSSSSSGPQTVIFTRSLTNLCRIFWKLWDFG